VPAALALLASVVWGLADFLGGAFSRRLHPVWVLMTSQLVGMSAMLVILVVGSFDPPGAYLWWAVLSSLSGTMAGICFYRALAIGTMSVVAPIAGTGLVLPVVVGLLRGERPSPLQLAGILLATLGVVLASGPELRGIGAQRRSVLLAIASAFGFGGALTLIPLTGEGRWAMTSAVVTLTGFLMTASFLVVVRPEGAPVTRRDLGSVCGIGLLNIAALTLYTAASTLGLVAVVAVLASLYPVVTVILAQRIYGERLRGIQLAGVLAAFAGVVGLAAG
jgi:drug/metabolite transporter (DMT)-like permease